MIWSRSCKKTELDLASLRKFVRITRYKILKIYIMPFWEEKSVLCVSIMKLWDKMSQYILIFNIMYGFLYVAWIYSPLSTAPRCSVFGQSLAMNYNSHRHLYNILDNLSTLQASLFLMCFENAKWLNIIAILGYCCYLVDKLITAKQWNASEWPCCYRTPVMHVQYVQYLHVA